MLSTTVDIEPTNRCNAWCSFCPRDQTPHQGLMSLEVFEQALARVVEYDGLRRAKGLQRIEQVSLCGLGEPLLNRHLAEMVRQVRAAGFRAHLSSNGALVTPTRAEALLDAGLSSAGLNVGEVGEAYEKVYRLPWERTLERVDDLVERSRGRARVFVVLVNHDPDRLVELQAFWAERGVGTFVYGELNNRGGALDLEGMRFAEYPEQVAAEARLRAMDEQPRCIIPFTSLTIGYDGRFYLCCMDWKKQAPLGDVFDTTLVELLERRLDHVLSRGTPCGTCSHDPVNRVTVGLRGGAAGDGDPTGVDDLQGRLAFEWAFARDVVERLEPGLVASAVRRAPPAGRRRIPVVVE